jgi:hypothetical protein
MGDAGRAWFPSHFSSIMLAGYGCVSMGHAGFLGKWGGERGGKNSGKNFQKSLSPLFLHLQGRRSCTVPFKMAQCSFFFHFFLRKGKQNLGVTQNWVMTDVKTSFLNGDLEEEIYMD